VKSVVPSAAIRNWHADAALEVGLRSKETRITNAEIFETFEGDTAIASAAEGARYAAASGQSADAGSMRARARIAGSLTRQVSDQIPCTGSAGVDADSGLATTVVRCEGSIRSVFLPFGAFVHIRVTSRALTEARG